MNTADSKTIPNIKIPKVSGNINRSAINSKTNGKVIIVLLRMVSILISLFFKIPQ